MSGVIRKRLTGGIILVLIGALVPFLLSSCMHGDSGGGSKSMRVYTIHPNGSAASDEKSSENGGGSTTGSTSAHAGGNVTVTSANPPPIMGGPSRAGTSAASPSPSSGQAAPQASSPAPSQSHPQSQPQVQPKSRTSGDQGRGGLENTNPSGWVVQAASFRDPHRAADLARRLQNAFHSFYSPGQVKGQT